MYCTNRVLGLEPREREGCAHACVCVRVGMRVRVRESVCAVMQISGAVYCGSEWQRAASKDIVRYVYMENGATSKYGL